MEIRCFPIAWEEAKTLISPLMILGSLLVTSVKGRTGWEVQPEAGKWVRSPWCLLGTGGVTILQKEEGKGWCERGTAGWAGE